MLWRIWFKLYEGERLIGAGVWHRGYTYKGNAERYAEKQFGTPRVNRNDGKTYTYRWIVSQTNPWGMG